VELEIAAQEEMKIIELRLAKLFKFEGRAIPATSQSPVSHSKKPEGFYPNTSLNHWPATISSHVYDSCDLIF